LSEPARREALLLAEQHPENPNLLNNASWSVVRKPGAEAEAYRRALVLAETACRLAPSNGYFLNTLGVAQYRVGHYRQALEALSHADKLNTAAFEGPIPADLSFQAMSYHQLGQKDKAQTALGQLRETMKKPRWAEDEEAIGFLREAEILVATPATAPNK
jgi:Flp pilus assembly protein TadD